MSWFGFPILIVEHNIKSENKTYYTVLDLILDVLFTTFTLDNICLGFIVTYHLTCCIRLIMLVTFYWLTEQILRSTTIFKNSSGHYIDHSYLLSSFNLSCYHKLACLCLGGYSSSEIENLDQIPMEAWDIVLVISKITQQINLLNPFPTKQKKR